MVVIGTAFSVPVELIEQANQIIATKKDLGEVYLRVNSLEFPLSTMFVINYTPSGYTLNEYLNEYAERDWKKIEFNPAKELPYSFFENEPVKFTLFSDALSFVFDGKGKIRKNPPFTDYVIEGFLYKRYNLKKLN